MCIRDSHSDVMTELADCGAVIVGSATHNNNVLPGIADVLTYMKGLRPQNRVAEPTMTAPQSASSVIKMCIRDSA